MSTVPVQIVEMASHPSSSLIVCYSHDQALKLVNLEVEPRMPHAMIEAILWLDNLLARRAFVSSPNMVANG